MQPAQPAITVFADTPSPAPKTRRRPARHLLAILAGLLVGLLVGVLGEIVSAGPAGGHDTDQLNRSSTVSHRSF
ncbi:hypothetical protein [Paractinoplanes lichenicola]|uniref:Uncharacterized protein n=1 Tax=Paractinoplanes lichenicola TaxID=2802976 RepID=A0ABS1VEF1_9ACTN|nr:hypothetical protein [Actinoplanes lichenicola]MBL7253054.1 hypothetical protein [Actinoplanes lichenicola]